MVKPWEPIYKSICICDMNDTHLLNTMKKLRCQAKRLVVGTEHEWQSRVDNIYWDMQWEARRRKLEVG